MQEQMTTVATAASAGRSHQVDRWFYISMALLIILLNLVAFGPSIIEPSGRNVPLPLTPLVMAHAIAAVGWLFLFLTQSVLVATGRTDVHRRVGIAGAALTLAFVVVGYFTIIEQARRGFDLSGDLVVASTRKETGPDPNLAGVLFNLTMFAVLAGAALWYRHRPAVHKRLMFLALVGGLTATPVAHLTGHLRVSQGVGAAMFIASSLAFAFSGAVYDRISQGRVHPVFLRGGILIFAANFLFFGAIQRSNLWREFVTGLIG